MIDSPLTETTQNLFGTKTRGKILLASLASFNTDGFDRVTTAQLAKTADVLEGTLWYHFKAKTDLVLAHLETLETRLSDHLGSDLTTSPDKIVSHFLEIFSIIWDFRYLLRDPLAALQDDDAIAVRLQKTYLVIEKRAEARIEQAVELGFIRLNHTTAQTLAVSAFLIGRYWLDYARIRFPKEQNYQSLRLQGIQQLVSLIRPHFTDKMVHVLEEGNIDLLTEEARS
ncbi:MAG: TetR/AcrR family transcriptional regulator [Pseudomonadota bacterium]